MAEKERQEDYFTSTTDEEMGPGTDAVFLVSSAMFV